MERLQSFQYKDPAKIPTEVIQEIICRRLINLPQVEKTFPRLLINIEEACWFFADEFCSGAPLVIDKKYERKFTQRIFHEWPLLRHHLPQLAELQEDFRLNYKSRIPSYGCVIFNKTLDKLLFCIYHNQRDRIVKKLDFPKGKVDEDETAIECAIREVQEETNILLRKDHINEE